MSFVLESSDALPFSLDTVKVIATDMDGTLTRNGRFSTELLQALEVLQQSGIAVIIVTGRSAGWVNGLVHYLPVRGAIAENGGVFFPSGDEYCILPDIPDMSYHRTALANTFHALQTDIPTLRESTDNSFRLTDWTFDVQGLSPQELEHLQNQVEAAQWSFTYSTVQCHIKPQGQDKAIALTQILKDYFPEVLPESVITVGDSPNDESLFNADLFPNSVGVANVNHYLDRLRYAPSYITQQPEVMGFCELVRSLIPSP